MEALPEADRVEHAETKPGATHWHAALTSSDPVGEASTAHRQLDSSPTARRGMSSLNEIVSRSHALPEDVLKELDALS